MKYITISELLIIDKMKEQKCLEEELYQIGLGILAAAVLFLPFFVSVILPKLDLSRSSCVFFLLFGAYCPGCGGTRAVNALLHGHFLQSLWYHPLVLYGAVLYLSFMISWTMARFRVFGIKRGIAFRAGYLYAMVVIIAVNFIAKNLLKFCFDIVMV